MAQQCLQNVSASNLPRFSSLDLEIDELKVGLVYPDENSAVNAILKWGEKTLCPLTKARREKGLDETNGVRRGRRCLDCPHGRKKQVTKIKGERPNQNVKFTKVNIKQTSHLNIPF